MTHLPAVRTTRSRPGRRRAGTVFALLLAGSLAAAGCGASSGGHSSSASDNKAAPTDASDAQAGRGDVSEAQAGPGDERTGGPAGATASGSAPGDKAVSGAGTPAPTRYLVRTADLTVRTPHVEDALDKARELAAAAGGYAAGEDTSVDGGGHAQSSIQLRVPPAGYDRLLTDLAGLGTLLERKVSTADVTGQVVDVASRITSQQASVARVRALMDRADRLSDVVSLEGELSTREAALESLEAQQTALRSQTDLATVTLRLTEPPVRHTAPKPAAHDGFWTTVGHALGNGWEAFYLMLRGILVVLSLLLPFLVTAALAWFGYRLVRRLLPRRTRTRASLRAPDGTPWQVPAPTVSAAPTVPNAPTVSAAPTAPGRKPERPGD